MIAQGPIANSILLCSLSKVRDKSSSDGVAYFLDSTCNVEVIVIDIVWFSSVDLTFRH